MRRLDQARTLSHQRIEDEAARRASTGGGVDAMLRAIPLLALSHVVLWIETAAAAAVDASDRGRPSLSTAPEIRGRTVTDDLTSRIGRVVEFVRSELDPDGVVLRNSVRAGAALTAAVLVAEVLPVEHGFWIVLATLLVLHSGAHSTYATAIGAMGGTLTGMAVGVVVILVVGDSTATYWVLFPIMVGVAAYVPGAVDFVVGQAAFAVLIVVLFGVLGFPGLETVEARVETVAVGAITAIVLSLVLWPRGAGAAMARSVAGLYRSAAAAASTFVRSGPASRGTVEADLVEAGRRAEATFAVALAEHADPIDVTAWARVLAPATLARALVIGLVPDVEHAPTECEGAIATVNRSADAAKARLSATADALTGTPKRAVVVEDVSVADLEPCVESCASRDDMWTALLIVTWSAMIQRLTDDVENASSALDDVIASSAPRAWLTRARRHSTVR